MIRVTSFAALQQILASFLNTLQDQAMSAAAANKNNDVSALTQGWDSRVWLSNAVLNNATQVQVDSSVDYRDRILHVWYRDLGGSAQKPGGASDHLFDAGTGTGTAPVTGYTGKGGYSNVNTLAAISAGTPPVIGTGGGANPAYALVLAGTRTTANGGAPTTPSVALLLYVDNTDGSLWLYNNSGGGLGNQLYLQFAFSGKTAKRP